MNNYNDLLSIDDLNVEKCRLRTFNKHWPHSYITPRVLAKIGFYYVEPHDQVKCHFCEVQVSSWEIGDNEVEEHEKWSMRLLRECPLFTGKSTRNIPLEPVCELNELLLAIRNRQRIKSRSVLKETPNAYFNQAEIAYINEPILEGEIDRMME